MMTLLHHNKLKVSSAFLGVILLAIAGAAFSIVINQVAGQRFRLALQDADLMKALGAQDEAALQAVSKNGTYEYQKIRNGEVVGASRADLPAHQYFHLALTLSPGVIMQDPALTLPATQPYKVWLGQKRYVAFPYFPSTAPEGYLVYVRAWP